MSDKKLRISKDDLGGGKGEDETGDKTVSMPAEESAKEDKKQTRDSWRGRVGASTTRKSSGAEAGPAAAADQAQRGFIRRQNPMVLVGSGIALFAVCFVGTFLLIDVLKTDRQRSEDALEYSTKAMTEVQEGIDRAKKEELPYSFLQNLAEASEDLAGKVESRKRTYEADVPDKPQLAGPTVAVMDADLKFLRSFASLATVKDEKLRSRWREIKRGMTSAARSINDERSEIQTQVSDDPALLPTEKSLNTSVASANGIVSNAADALEVWFVQLRRIKNQCEQVVDFSDTSSSLIEDFREQDDETRLQLNKSGLRTDEARNILSQEAGRRRALAREMDASYEAAPETAREDWTEIIKLVGESVEQLGKAATNLEIEKRGGTELWSQSRLAKPTLERDSGLLLNNMKLEVRDLRGQLARAQEEACNRTKPPRPAI